MARLILTLLLFLASLVNFFPVPAKEVWYVGIAVPEFPWIFMLASLLLLVWSFFKVRFRRLTLGLGVVSFLIFLSPIVRAYAIGSGLNQRLTAAFGTTPDPLPGFHQPSPFTAGRMFSGTGAVAIPFKTFTYSAPGGVALTLNFSAAAGGGLRPCIVEVHGGSWKRGDNTELAHFNTYFANAGYHVATINYRLAPAHKSPAQAQDIHAALQWLRSHAGELNIDTANFILTGRSAGAQLVLAAAYSGAETGIKGVAAFYGPTDMLWTYEHPDNPLIMDSRLVQRDFLGGAPAEVPDRYIAESPLFHVSARTVPTLLVHGRNDAHVYVEQSERLHKKLDSLAVPNLFLLLPWATHGCEYNLSGPSGQLSVYAMERFLYAVTRR